MCSAETFLKQSGLSQLIAHSPEQARGREGRNCFGVLPYAIGVGRQVGDGLPVCRQLPSGLDFVGSQRGAGERQPKSVACIHSGGERRRKVCLTACARELEDHAGSVCAAGQSRSVKRAVASFQEAAPRAPAIRGAGQKLMQHFVIAAVFANPEKVARSRNGAATFGSRAVEQAVGHFHKRALPEMSTAEFAQDPVFRAVRFQFVKGRNGGGGTAIRRAVEIAIAPVKQAAFGVRSRAIVLKMPDDLVTGPILADPENRPASSRAALESGAVKHLALPFDQRVLGIVSIGARRNDRRVRENVKGGESGAIGVHFEHGAVTALIHGRGATIP